MRLDEILKVGPHIFVGPASGGEQFLPAIPGNGFHAHRAAEDFGKCCGDFVRCDASRSLEFDGAALESLEAFGLADRASHYPDQLSGGERQRVAIARAVVGNRQLLLADEPSGALDSTSAESVMRLILAACHLGTTAVVVTHDAQLASWADRVVFLRDGRIVDQTQPVEDPNALLAQLPNQ